MEIHLDVPLPGTPDQVWEAVATGPGLATWFMAMPFDPNSDSVTALDPPRLLTVVLGDTRFDYGIEPAGGGALLHFTHVAPGDDRTEAITTRGWAMYFETLAQYLTHFSGRPATYVEADGPETTGNPDDWSHLLARLGNPTLGAPASVELDTGPITGTVDHLTDDYLGILTDDSLIRFHGRWELGMPIAVSHRRYAPTPDPAALQQAWTTWLTEED